MHTLDFEKQYQKNVMDYFFREYKAGRTPNPDVMCNKEIKFKLLYDWAMKNGFDFLATGHYAQIACNMNHKTYSKKSLIHDTSCMLLRSKDEFKDQTYFIYNIKNEQLPHILFPIGHLKKAQVKKMAEKIGLPNAKRKESMGLCFVGKIRLKDFLQQKLKAKKGDIKQLKTGQVLGKHRGLHNFTIGQRQGIQVGAGGPYYVAGKDLKTNTLYVTNDPEDEHLYVKEVQLHSVNWIDSDLRFKIKDLRLKARYRHQGELVKVSMEKLAKDLYRAVFESPQKAVASGQSMVLYKGKECVGGGVIV
jgi:tRNA-specific 2-thiouridylase